VLLQKFPAREFSADTELELPAEERHIRAGLIVMGLEHAALEVQCGADGYVVRLLKNQEVVAETRCDKAKLRVTVADGGLCQFGVVRSDGKFQALGPAFQAKPGRWIGAKVGIYCFTANPNNTTGYADFAYFRIGKE
jgi:hypothetical protein